MTSQTPQLCHSTGTNALRPPVYKAPAGSLLVRMFDALLTWQDRASQRHRLSMMDDHALRDVGLSRADLDAEISKPFWRA